MFYKFYIFIFKFDQQTLICLKKSFQINKKFSIYLNNFLNIWKFKLKRHQYFSFLFHRCIIIHNIVKRYSIYITYSLPPFLYYRFQNKLLSITSKFALIHLLTQFSSNFQQIRSVHRSNTHNFSFPFSIFLKNP